jgi:uncharacterized protein YkwD
MEHDMHSHDEVPVPREVSGAFSTPEPSPSLPPEPKPEPPPVPQELNAPEEDEAHVQQVVVVPDTKAAMRRKRTARLRLIIIIAALVMAGAGIWTFQNFSSSPLEKIASFESMVTSDVQSGFSSFPQQNIIAPRSNLTATQATLDAKGVIADTNKERATHGNLPALQENATLDDIATLRLDNMFAHQYFAHVSPTGESALTVASSVGYNHIALGENLAEGWFNGDQGVLDAWMASPGHRANILDTHYTEIGVAAREGMFQGRETWIAVQVFGKPASACPPPPDPTLRTAIANAQEALVQMESSLKTMKSEIDAMDPQSGSAYNQKVSSYNTLVSTYNMLAAQTKTQIENYNGAAAAYNACL